MTAFHQPQLFELSSKDGNYHVRYAYTQKDNGTEMEYFKLVEIGELEGLFQISVLENLKEILESK